MTELSREQVEHIFWRRYGKYICSSESETVHYLNDPKLLSWLRGPGNVIADWHFNAFAEIDDLIKSCPDNGKKSSIKLVLDNYACLNHAHEYDSFESMYYEFKRDKELKYRRRRFAEQLFDGNAEEATEHFYRLSLITDINSLFGSSE